MKWLLGLGALFGAFVGWAMDRDAAFVAPARIVGRAGWALLALCVAGLVLSGCATTQALVDACREGLCR